jgi:hypothetical protein
VHVTVPVPPGEGALHEPFVTLMLLKVVPDGSVSLNVKCIHRIRSTIRHLDGVRQPRAAAYRIGRCHVADTQIRGSGNLRKECVA